MFEFTSDRKRMSVIVRDLDNKRIRVLTKGADSIILKRIDHKFYAGEGEAEGLKLL